MAKSAVPSAYKTVRVFELCEPLLVAVKRDWRLLLRIIAACGLRLRWCVARCVCVCV